MKIKYYKLKEIPSDFDIRNDMIEDVEISCCRNSLNVNLVFKSNSCDVGGGFNETYNVGNILIEYARLLNLDTDQGRDIIDMLKGTPIRVAFKFETGSFTVDNCYIGNFMEDRFIYLKELFGRS